MAIKWQKDEPLAYELIRLILDVQKERKKTRSSAAIVERDLERDRKTALALEAAVQAPAKRRARYSDFIKPASLKLLDRRDSADAATIKRPPPPKPTAPAKKKRERRSDLMVAALGITLGLICAMFPWYIFFNQEEFGIRAMKFQGNGGMGSGPVAIGPQPERVGAPMSIENPPETELDLFATGTLPAADGADGSQAISALDQPFPIEEPFFKIIHVENGRAMLEDESGLWVVQRGSALPDSSRIASIEERDGRWVVVTNRDRVIEVTP